MLDPDDRRRRGGGRRGSSRPAAWHSPSVRPPAISSSSSSFGSVASARASSSRLRSSRVRLPAGTLARSREPGLDQDVGAALGDVRAPSAPSRRLAATSRFSKTVSLPKGCGIWNVRPMPVGAAPHRRQARDVPAAEADAAAVEREIAGDQVEQRRLAGAVRPDDAERLALVDVERDRVGDLEGAEALRQAFEFEDRHATSGSQWAGRSPPATVS